MFRRVSTLLKLPSRQAIQPRPLLAPMRPFRTKFPLRYFSKETVKVPSMGESITEGAIQSWVKKPGDYVDMDEVVVVIESDKLSQEIRSPQAGVITECLAGEGDEIPVGADLFIVDTSQSKPAEAPSKEAPKEAPKEATKEAPKEEAPKEEPKKAEKPKEQPKPQEKPKEKAPPAPPKPVAVSGQREEKREKMNRMRKRIAERLKSAQNTYAMLTTFQECDMSRAIELRNAYKDEFQKKHGVKLGFMSFFVKAATHALQQIPVANAVIDGEEIIYRNFADISVAVATPKGLVVPVLRDCHLKSYADIEKEIAYFGHQAKEGTLALEDMTGGNFTISNGGVYGSMMGTPIINPPQSAILGMHNIENRPVVREDKIVARPMMYLALTYDHRLLDGKDAVTFLRTIKLSVEEPSRMLLEL